MSEDKVQNKFIEQDPPLADSPQLERKNNDYLAYLKEKLNFILATYGRRLTSVNGDINELTRTASETTSRISNAEGEISAISQRADNIELAVAGTEASLSSIGGRNYWWSLDPKIHPDVTLTNVTVTYDEADNGKYVVKCSQATSSFAQALFPASIIPVPAELIGKKMILHADYISASGTNDARVFIVIADSNGSQISAIWLTTSEMSKTFTVPNGAVSFQPLIRVRQTGSTAVNESVTVRGIKLERGDVKTDWSPAPEDAVNGGNIISKINVSTEGVTIAGNKVNLTGYVTFNNLSTSGQTTINGANVTTGIIKDAANKNSWNLATGAFTLKDGSIDITTSTESDDKIILQSTTNNITYSLRLTPGSINLKASGGSMKNRTLQFSRGVWAMRFLDDDGTMAGIANGQIWVGGQGGGGFNGNVNLYKADGTLGNQMVAAGDSVIEKGTSGDWTYRKWYSGVYECWARMTPSLKVQTGWGQVYYATTSRYTYPVAFTGSPYEQVSVVGGYGAAWIGGAAYSPTQTQSGIYYVLRGQSSSSETTYNIDFYVRGTVS